jgi:prepilin-type N-terminal cleavage/methylation domain-containing protein
MTTPSFPKVLHRRHGKKRGFTLLELVVALVVLGILAALAVPTYLTVIGNAKSAVATSDALSVATDAVAIASGTDNYATESEFNNYSYNSANNIGDIAAYTPDLSAIHITSGPDAGDNNDAP